MAPAGDCQSPRHKGSELARAHTGLYSFFMGYSKPRGQAQVQKHRDMSSFPGKKDTGTEQCSRGKHR